jgi:glucuronate isomerase
MNREELLGRILQMDVWDTHTHLTPEALPAKSFWEIGHYFWFLRELQAAGYPARAGQLPPEERVEAYVEAFRATRNTSMNWVVRRILRDLYEVEITDVESIWRADDAVRHAASEPEWPRRVVERLAIRRICVHRQSQVEFRDLPGAACAIPGGIGLNREKLVEDIQRARDRPAAAEKVCFRVKGAIARLSAAGIKCVRVPADPFDRMGWAGPDLSSPIRAAEASAVEIQAYIGHTIFEALAENGMTAQMFLGVDMTTESTRIAVNDTHRIAHLHGLFERYPCRFELIIGSPLNNLDAVQAARVFPNVYVGGMWWYNFRTSTYRQALQYRLEALPSLKSSIIASDARCIEWCYGKILLVKRLLAEFLHDQIERGWLDDETALYVAGNWLHRTAAALYG